MDRTLLHPSARSLKPVILFWVNSVQNVYSLYGWIPGALWRCAFLCGHPNTVPGEGKSFCPDCGEGIVYRWKVLRCNCCQARQEVRYLLHRWVPARQFCRYCGASAFREQALDNARYHQLHLAYLSAVLAQEYERSFYVQRPGSYSVKPSSAPVLALLST